MTGSSGFIGLNLIKYLESSCSIKKYQRNDILKLNHDIVIHLAGKAHDIKNVSSSVEYYDLNTELTKKIYNSFISSNAKVFIYISSVKAVADEVVGVLKEQVTPNPITHYGKSKLFAEQYIQSKPAANGKRVYILRPCMIHGPGNKGNLNLLYSLVSKGLPWPLGSFANLRSYLSIENLCFIIKELIDLDNIPSGVYNVADDTPLSTNEIIKIIAESKSRELIILNLNKSLIRILANIGDCLKLPLNSERLLKLTNSYVVCNAKIKAAIGKPLPVSSKEGLLKTFQSFSSNA
jgi:nucleoside-diphosphate-sugar epimerase